MDSRDDHGLTTADAHHLRRYIIRAAKAYLCASCWFALWAVLLLHGPPAMSVPSDPTQASGVVPAISGIVLSGGAAVVLTIVLATVAVGLSDWKRSQSAAKQDGSDAHDGMEDESHV